MKIRITFSGRYKLGKLDNAIREFEDALRLGNTHRLLFCDMIEECIKAGKIAEAERYLECAFERKVEIRPLTYMALFSVYYGDNKFEDIVELFNKLDEGMRTHTGLRIRYGEALRKLERYKEALKVFEGVISGDGVCDDHRHWANVNKAYVLKDMGMMAEASAILHGLYFAIPDDNSCYPLIVCGLVFWNAFRGDEITGLRQKINMLIEKNRGNPETLRRALAVLDQLGTESLHENQASEVVSEAV